MRGRFVVITALFAALIAPVDADACPCTKETARSASQGDVFWGRLTSVSGEGSGPHWTMKVERAYHGRPPLVAKITSYTDDPCGYPFEDGRAYAVSGFEYDGSYFIDACSFVEKRAVAPDVFPDGFESRRPYVARGGRYEPTIAKPVETAKSKELGDALGDARSEMVAGFATAISACTTAYSSLDFERIEVPLRLYPDGAYDVMAVEFASDGKGDTDAFRRCVRERLLVAWEGSRFRGAPMRADLRFEEGEARVTFSNTVAADPLPEKIYRSALLDFHRLWGPKRWALEAARLIEGVKKYEALGPLCEVEGWEAAARQRKAMTVPREHEGRVERELAACATRRGDWANALELGLGNSELPMHEAEFADVVRRGLDWSAAAAPVGSSEHRFFTDEADRRLFLEWIRQTKFRWQDSAIFLEAFAEAVRGDARSHLIAGVSYLRAARLYPEAAETYGAQASKVLSGGIETARYLGDLDRAHATAVAEMEALESQAVAEHAKLEAEPAQEPPAAASTEVAPAVLEPAGGSEPSETVTGIPEDFLEAGIFFLLLLFGTVVTYALVFRRK